MNDFLTETKAETGSLDRGQDLPSMIYEKPETQTRHPAIEELLDIDEIAASRLPAVDENYINQKRLESLRTGFTDQLLNLICEDDFEYGIDTKADVLVRDQMKKNALATKSWLNSMFVENFANPTILVGLLRIVARLDYLDIYPEGQTMAVAGLSNSNVEVQECGIRAFESWTTLESLHVLENLSVSAGWLKEYVDQVVADLRKEYNVPVGQEN